MSLYIVCHFSIIFLLLLYIHMLFDYGNFTLYLEEVCLFLPHVRNTYYPTLLPVVSKLVLETVHFHY